RDRVHQVRIGGGDGVTAPLPDPQPADDGVHGSALFHSAMVGPAQAADGEEAVTGWASTVTDVLPPVAAPSSTGPCDSLAPIRRASRRMATSTLGLGSSRRWLAAQRLPSTRS